MLMELTRLLNNACINSELIDKRNLMLMTKLTNSKTDGQAVDALMIQVIAVQQEDELGIMETHHSVINMEMFTIHEWDKSGVETVKLTKLLDSMVLDLESKFRQHRQAVIDAGVKQPEEPGIITELSINQTKKA